MNYRERVLNALKEGKIIYYDSEYCFPDALNKTEWRYKPASLRVQSFKVGNKPVEVYDVWKTQHKWDRLFDLLEQGYFLVAHNAIADIRPDLCDDRILKYAFNGQVMDTLYMERLIHGMTDPINSQEVSTEEDDDETEEVGKRSTPFALDSVILRHTGQFIKKTYQDARTWLKRDLSDAMLEYASNDVKYLPTIVENQINEVERLNLWEIIELNHELLATSYIIKKQGVPIDREELTKHREYLVQKSNELEKKLLEVMPEVGYTDTQLVDIYFDRFWVKGKGMCGLTSKAKAAKIVKNRENHAVTTAVFRWIDQNKESITRPVNLRSSGQRLQAFKLMGFDIESTAETVLREYTSKNEAPAIEKYLEWQKINSLLTKVLNNLTYDKYLRKDNTVASTYTWVKALNGRSSSQDMNVQQLPRELKSLYGKPKDKIKIEYDYSAIELMKLLNDFPVDSLTPLLLDDSEDIHLYNAATFFQRNYEELKKLHKNKDPEVKKLRNAAKTVIYFLQYKTVADPNARYVTGVNRLIETFNNQLDWDLDRNLAEQLILKGEATLAKWSAEKRRMDQDISKLANDCLQIESETLKHLKENEEDLKLARDEGLIYFRGACNMYYKFDLLRDHIYTPSKVEWDLRKDDYVERDEYINNRSLYSCRIAGPVAIAAKQAVRYIQKELHERFGYSNAWLGLFVHDSATAYCDPDLADRVEEVVTRHLLEQMVKYGEFNKVPVFIEGGVEGKEEVKKGLLQNKYI